MTGLTKRRAVVAGAALAVTATMAFAPAALASGSTGTATVTISGNGYSVTSAGSSSMTVAIGGTATGNLGSANWADATGSGAGWHGSVAVSPLTYTGQWSGSGTALASTSAGAYTGTQNGVYYKVTVTSASASQVDYSYTSTDTTDPSGTGSATLSGGNLVGTVGTTGLTISFTTSGTYTTNDTYVVDVGTQTNTMTFSGTGAAVTAVGTTSVAPVYYAANATQSISSGGLKFLDALPLTGMSGSTGYYTAAPGVSFTPDSNSWAGAYTGTVTYSISSGP